MVLTLWQLCHSQSNSCYDWVIVLSVMESESLSMQCSTYTYTGSYTTALLSPVWCRFFSFSGRFGLYPVSECASGWSRLWSICTHWVGTSISTSWGKQMSRYVWNSMRGKGGREGGRDACNRTFYGLKFFLPTGHWHCCWSGHQGGKLLVQWLFSIILLLSLM